MKARVKATGKIVEVAYYGLGVYVDMNKWDEEYNFDEIIILDNGDPDYWTRLEHQYAGMAIQGMLNNSLLITGLLKVNKSHEDIVDKVTSTAIRYAHALVEKYKKEK